MENRRSPNVEEAKRKKYSLSDIFSSPDGICFFITDSEDQELARLVFGSEKDAQKSRAAMEIVLANAVAFVPALLVLMRREANDAECAN